MKKKSMSLALITALFATSAQAVTFTFDAGGGNGVGVQSFDVGNDFALAFTGSNGAGSGPISTFTTVLSSDLVATVTWEFLTDDDDGPEYDPFGYTTEYMGVDDSFQITDDSGPDGQSGSFSLSLLAGTILSFYIDSTDGCCGGSSVTLASAGAPLGALLAAPSPVPLPASGLLLLAGAGGLTALRRKKKAA